MGRKLVAVVRCGVIGVGHLGKFHAQKYSILENCKLVVLADPNPANALTLSKKLKCDYVEDFKQILKNVDVVSIVAPTSLHFEITSEVLKSGVNVLLEKPITESVEEARLLDELAKKNKLLLQIGHLERFNPAILKLKEVFEEEKSFSGVKPKPNFIEAVRISPFKPRAIDVDVIIDLMIHDIDLILEMVDSPITRISAKGAKVLSNTIDIANARIEFQDGCVANITSSRVSDKTERKMRVFTNKAYHSIDFQSRQLKSTYLENNESNSSKKHRISSKNYKIGPADALETEIRKFINSFTSSTPVAVSASDGIKALEIAILIAQKIHESIS
jgi:predicted dehydrogenase